MTKSPQQTPDKLENPLTIEIPENAPITQGLIERKTEESKLGSSNVYSPKNDTVLCGSVKSPKRSENEESKQIELLNQMMLKIDNIEKKQTNIEK